MTFLKHDHLLKELTLISKNENPEKVNGHRPISVCTVSYKYISKLLGNILSIVLPKLILHLKGCLIQVGIYIIIF